MSYKDKESRKEYMRELMARRRLMMKQQGDRSTIAEKVGQEPEVESKAEVESVETPTEVKERSEPLREKQPAAVTSPKVEVTRPYMFINTFFSKIKTPEYMAEIINRNFKQNKGWVIVEFSNGKEPVVIFKNQHTRNNPDSPKGICDYILDDDWGYYDILRLLKDIEDTVLKEAVKV